MILVTGATGTIGREVLRRLPAGRAVRIMARNPGRVARATQGAEIVHGDFTDSASLTDALHNVHTAFLVTNPDGNDDARFLDPARAAGVRHIVKLSAAAVTDPRADDLITRHQRHNEELLRASGMDWTLLRPRAFMSNTLSWARSIRADGVVRALYGTSANACVDPRDVAEAAVRALTGTAGEHAGRAYTLTGPQALSAAQQTAELADLLGQELRFEELSPQQARTALGARYPADIADALLESAGRQHGGSKAVVDPTLPGLLGRPARTFRGWANDHLDAFGPVPAARD
ncbi:MULTISPECIES: SDR family oxidoreductase [unclassified Streptomyces]|uniref:SDR family oxidoreductase n=1 Tax=unclassified Streptomyces TaxID=2593676 RepID=UPI002ED5DD81|nr:SDR family oxidoreductase [Streptomyces sp. NBC_00891]WSY10185.1 SDR family oxidoreductase [Streptomyces sp. NBC_00890]WSZ11681.1 SDR family oxidoreductase [Streptomyces sp. NBC_00869]WSZ27913.1 SDR family oxidoreductase [Streptomyces sp. NBC_00870]